MLFTTLVDRCARGAAVTSAVSTELTICYFSTIEIQRWTCQFYQPALVCVAMCKTLPENRLCAGVNVWLTFIRWTQTQLQLTIMAQSQPVRVARSRLGVSRGLRWGNVMSHPVSITPEVWNRTKVEQWIASLGAAPLIWVQTDRAGAAVVQLWRSVILIWCRSCCTSILETFHHVCLHKHHITYEVHEGSSHFSHSPSPSVLSSATWKQVVKG